MPSSHYEEVYSHDAPDNNPQDDAIGVTDRRRHDFYIIDNEVIREYGPKIKLLGIGVYNALACYANQDGKAWPSQNTIAKDLGISRGTVRSGIALLEEHGLIKTDPRKKENGSYTSTVYTLLPVEKSGGVGQLANPSNGEKGGWPDSQRVGQKAKSWPEGPEEDKRNNTQRNKTAGYYSVGKSSLSNVSSRATGSTDGLTEEPVSLAGDREPREHDGALNSAARGPREASPEEAPGQDREQREHDRALQDGAHGPGETQNIPPAAPVEEAPVETEPETSGEVVAPEWVPEQVMDSYLTARPKLAYAGVLTTTRQAEFLAEFELLHERGVDKLTFRAVLRRMLERDADPLHPLLAHADVLRDPEGYPPMSEAELVSWWQSYRRENARAQEPPRRRRKPTIPPEFLLPGQQPPR